MCPSRQGLHLAQVDAVVYRVSTPGHTVVLRGDFWIWLSRCYIVVIPVEGLTA